MRYNQVGQALRQAPKNISSETVDALLAQYDEGFRKLALAQERPRCVFHTGLGVMAALPHLDAASRYRAVAVLKVRRELEQGNLNRSLHDLSRLLRLSRDLLPEGGSYADMLWASVIQRAVDEVVLLVLSHPGLTVQHCDRLLALLIEHEVRSIDMDSEVLRAEYLGNRATLRDLVFHQDRLREALKSAGADMRSSLTAEIAEPRMTLLAGNGRFPQPDVSQRLKNLASHLISLHQTQGLDARMAGRTPEEMTQQVEKMNAFYRRDLALAQLPYLERFKRTAEPLPELSTFDLYTRVTKAIIDTPSINNLTEIIARGKALLRDAQGLTAIRLWQLRHDGAMPPSLADAVNETGLPAVPIDPYTGGSVRMAIIDGQAVVYCLGKDGLDDHGHKAALLYQNLGDVLLRMPHR